MSEGITLSFLQNFIKKKDFRSELRPAYFLKLIEEVGELAEVLRKGKRMEDGKIKGTLEEELYDVLYYILALANVYDVDMEDCYFLKEKVNDKKYGRE